MARALIIAPLAAAAMLGAFQLGRMAEHEPRPVPVLIGHGCQNGGGDLFAFEESDFPPCELIELNTPHRAGESR